ncbi:MAG: hypothetical protein LAN84_14810 [Acidobacteriia bacterium]|nr:hypothetical protein [Terriglobia bacterium]
MKAILAVVLSVLLVLGAVPARADFQYTETSKITGGAMKSMMKTVGMFNKQASQAMKPVTTTLSLKGNKLRRESSDGKIRIIDLDGRRIIELDSQNKAYSQITFEELKAAMKKAQEDAQARAKQAAKQPDANAKLNVKVSATAGEGSREILGLATHEVKVKMEMEEEATPVDQKTGKPSAASAKAAVITDIDSWVTPKVPGHEELMRFYRLMAKETDWVPPSTIRVDPRLSKSMGELQKNQDDFKGMPLLQYVSMSVAAPDGAAASSAPPAKSSASSHENVPTSASGAMVKGLGGLFGKKKKKQEEEEAAAQDSKNPPPPANPNALIEMTIEVTSFSSDTLSGSLFEIPAGYTRVQGDPSQFINPSPEK